MNFKIDNLQYCKWDRSVFEINREAGLDAVHVTIVYHEDFDELQKRILEWKEHFKNHDDLIFLGKDFRDIEKAKKNNKTAIFFWFQKSHKNHQQSYTTYLVDTISFFVW